MFPLGAPSELVQGRGYIGDDCGNPLNMDCDREHSGADCGKIHCSLLCRRDFMFRGWGRVRSRYDWWYVRYCILQEIGNGFNCACCSFPISEEIYLGFWLAQDVYKISK